METGRGLTTGESKLNDFVPSEKSILVLDSNPLEQAVFRDALQSADYLVITASDLGEAVDRLNLMRPDLLLTCPYINSMSGPMAADYLRGRAPGLPVLIVAGFMNDDRVVVAKAVANYHTFPKPFTRDELLAEVRRILSGND